MQKLIRMEKRGFTFERPVLRGGEKSVKEVALLVEEVAPLYVSEKPEMAKRKRRVKK